MPTLTRPMFSNQAQNGGIVSTLPPQAPGMTPEAQTLPPEARPQAQAQAQGMMGSALQGPIDSAVAEEIAATNMELDSAETVDEILAAMGGTASSTEEARTELATIVGEQDANNTPESVLPITQTTLQLVAAVESTNGQGGLGNLLGAPGELTANTMGTPVGDPTNPLAAPTMEVPAEGFQPVAGFFQGGLSGTPSIYGPGSNPLLTTVPTVDPTTAAVAQGDPSLIQGLPQPLPPIIPDAPPLPDYRGEVPVTPADATPDAYKTGVAPVGGPEPVTGNISPPFDDQNYDYSQLFTRGLGLNSIAVPQIDAITRLANTKRAWLNKFLPGKPDLEQITEKRTGQLEEYIEPKPDLEQIKAEHAEVYGDIEKDLQTEAWLSLATFGANIANSRGSVVQAVAKSLPGLAEDLSGAVKAKRDMERERNLLSRTEFKTAESTRRAEQLAIAQEALTTYDTRLAAHEQGVQRVAELGFQFGQELEAGRIGDHNATTRIKAQLATEISGQAPLFYRNRRTGKHQTGIRTPGGLFDQNGDWMGKDWVQIDYDDYYRGTVGAGSPIGDLTRQTVTIFDPNKDAGLYEREAFYDEAARYWTRDFDTNELVPLHSVAGAKGYQYVTGSAADAVSEEVTDTGEVIQVFNKGPFKGNARVVEFTANLPDRDADGAIKYNYDAAGRRSVAYNPITYRTNSLYGISNDNVLAYQVGTVDDPATPEDEGALLHFTPWAKVPAEQKAVHLQDIAQMEDVIGSLLNVLGDISSTEDQLVTGPMARLRFMGNTVGAFIPGWPTHIDQARAAQQWRLGMEDVVIAETPSTRLPVRQVEYVRDEIATMPDQFMENPEVALTRIQELLRYSQNKLSEMQGQVTGQPHLQIRKVPNGRTIDQALDWSDPLHRNLILTMQNGSYEDVRNSFNEHHLFIPKSSLEGNPTALRAVVSGPRGDGIYTTIQNWATSQEQYDAAQAATP